MRTEASHPFHIPTWVILLIAAVNGLIYLFLVPPWQHYDEPGHFEYVWLMANLEKIPDMEIFDAKMRREMLASMIEHDFFSHLGGIPNLVLLDEPPWIGIQQIDDPPLYYLLASIPLRIFSGIDITFQLYLARLVSSLLFLGTIWVALQAGKDIYGEQSIYVSTVGLIMALLPGFVELMTAVNNDVGAIAISSLYYWIGLRVLLKGINFARFVLLIACCIAGYYTKSTAYIMIFLLPLVVFGGIPGRSKWGVVQVLVSLGYLLILGSWVFDWQNACARYFLPCSAAEVSLRVDAPLGRKVLSIDQGKVVLQKIPSSNYHLLQGEAVIVGAYLWSDSSRPVRLPGMIVNGEVITTTLLSNLWIDNEPAFYSYTISLPQEVQQAYIQIANEPSDFEQPVYVDGMLVIRDNNLSPGTPQIWRADGSGGSWNGVAFENLVRNGSFEKTFPAIDDRVRNFLYKGRINADYFWGALDWGLASEYYREALWRIFQTFWGYFGWGHIPLLWEKWIYQVLLAFTVLIITGIVIRMFYGERKIHWFIVAIITWIVLAQLWLVLVRGAGSWFRIDIMPVARYFYPVILPLAIGISLGLTEWLNVFRCRRWVIVNLGGVGIGLNILAWYSIATFYFF